MLTIGWGSTGRGVTPGVVWTPEQAQRRFVEFVRGQLTADERRVFDLPLDQRTPAEELAARKIDLRFQKTVGEIEKQIDPADRKLYDELKKRIGELAPQVPPIPQSFAFYSPVTSPHRMDVLPSIGFFPLQYEPIELSRHKTYLMVRGDVHRLGEDVRPEFPEVLRDLSSTATPKTRKELADWLTRTDQPLVPRVWVNRIWQYHFGRGLVATSDDFGIRGTRPTHPELLDWLAAEFVEHGWSTRHIHRLIVTSAAYQQSAKTSQANRNRDPDNRWLSRYRHHCQSHDWSGRTYGIPQ